MGNELKWLLKRGGWAFFPLFQHKARVKAPQN